MADKYRLLTRGDVIERTDECLSDETWGWVVLGNAIVGPGMPYNPGFFVPMRRRVECAHEWQPDPDVVNAKYCPRCDVTRRVTANEVADG